jgi:hypothetical protein
MNLTNAQREWLRRHPTYSPIGRLRPGIVKVVDKSFPGSPH